MFSGGTVTTSDIGTWFGRAVWDDYCPQNQSESFCQAWCPTMDPPDAATGQEVCAQAERPNHPPMPAWNEIPANLQAMIADPNHVGSLGYTTVAEVQAAYEAMRSGAPIPQPGAAAPAAPTQPTPPPPTTTQAQPAQQQQEEGTESSMPFGHQLQFSIGYNAAPITGVQGDPLPAGADYYGTGATEFYGEFFGRIGYEHIWDNNFFLGGGLQIGVSASQRQQTVMGESFEDGDVVSIDAYLDVGYRFDLGKVGLKLYADAIIGYALSTDYIFLNGLMGPIDFGAFDIGGGAGLALQIPFGRTYIEIGLEGGGRYNRMDIEGWRAGTSNQLGMPSWFLNIPVTLGIDF